MSRNRETFRRNLVQLLKNAGIDRKDGPERFGVDAKWFRRIYREGLERRDARREGDLRNLAEGLGLSNVESLWGYVGIDDLRDKIVRLWGPRRWAVEQVVELLARDETAEAEAERIARERRAGAIRELISAVYKHLGENPDERPGEIDRWVEYWRSID
ncbi:MAG: hypothetical protein BGO49_20805 [Planctomycetales bacterium 71-10]|nr:MAG: hypothetical protein BGO49_20805 [Planctomycetales bacterium 71-10]